MNKTGAEREAAATAEPGARPLDSRHLIDRELLEWLDIMPSVELTLENLAEVREKWREPLPFDSDETAAAVNVLRYSVRRAGLPDVPLRVYQPARIAGALGCILHIHGGGYVGGESGALEPLHRRMTAELQCTLVSVDYRLAPETKFPGNIEDCYAALSWVFSQATVLSVDPRRIGVMGESAGGGLAAALALLARDRGEFKLAFQHLIYPMLDDRTCSTSDQHPFAGAFVWTLQNNHFGWSALLGAPPGPGQTASPYAAPARADDLAKLPPTFILTAALDLFLEENIEFARRLLRAGVPAELHVYPGAIHGFDLHPTARVARRARRDSMAALARALGTY